MYLAAALNTIEKAFKPPQECAAPRRPAGASIKGDACYESHNAPDRHIKYISKRYSAESNYKNMQKYVNTKKT